MNNTSIIQVLLVLKKINIVPVQAIYFIVFNFFTNKSRKKNIIQSSRRSSSSILAEFSGPKYNTVQD